MSDKTRRKKLEAMLASDGNDPFLRYALAMEYVSAGDHATAVQQFSVLTAPGVAKPYVPAFLMGAQSLVKLGKSGDAVPLLREGIKAAKKQGDSHAAGEMEALLESLE
jgi:predicted Zn-dependent protease